MAHAVYRVPSIVQILSDPPWTSVQSDTGSASLDHSAHRRKIRIPMSFDLSFLEWTRQWLFRWLHATRVLRSERVDLQPDPNIAGCHRELISRWPEIDSICDQQADDTDVCPWSSALDHSDAHVLISCIWSAAEQGLPASVNRYKRSRRFTPAFTSIQPRFSTRERLHASVVLSIANPALNFF